MKTVGSKLLSEVCLGVAREMRGEDARDSAAGTAVFMGRVGGGVDTAVCECEWRSV